MNPKKKTKVMVGRGLQKKARLSRKLMESEEGVIDFSNKIELEGGRRRADLYSQVWKPDL